MSPLWSIRTQFTPHHSLHYGVFDENNVLIAQCPTLAAAAAILTSRSAAILAVLDLPQPDHVTCRTDDVTALRIQSEARKAERLAVEETVRAEKQKRKTIKK